MLIVHMVANAAVLSIVKIFLKTRPEHWIGCRTLRTFLIATFRVKTVYFRRVNPLRGTLTFLAYLNGDNVPITVECYSV